MSAPVDVPDGIAIIGAAGRFPGAATLEQFWQNLTGGVESLTFADDAALRAAGIPEADFRAPNYVRARGVLDAIDQFDAAFFGILPREAEVMDPQQRLFLECAWEALESAGYCGETYPGLIGVYAGAYIDTYLLANLCANPAFLQHFVQSIQVGSLQTELGNDKDYLATRVSYKLHLRGPSMTVQTACSTSLVAIAQACQSLLTFGCDMALAGGVTITLPQARGSFYQEDGMVSPDGHCRPFDAQGRGTIFSNGLGIVVLKRLADALADRDDIWAVIRGWAVNNDGGAKFSFTAPSVDGQAQVIAMAQALAGVDARSISYVEAHGTATPLGDPIEVTALTRAFAETTSDTGFCALGSLKSNIGHLDVASGVAAVIKTALCLRHQTLVPSLHFTKANPKIAFADTPFVVSTSTRAWTGVPLPRRAGVSSFGFGGTNAHAVLEEAPVVPRPPSTRPCQLLLLSTRTAPALAAASERLGNALEHPTAAPDLADAAWTLQAGRKRFLQRGFVVARSSPDAAAALRDARRFIAGTAPATPPGIVFLFPGQGAQHPGMARELYATEPVFRADIDRSAERLAPELGLDLRDLLFPVQADAEAAHRLQQTALAQPALFVVSHALAQLWISWGVRPDLLIGHSVGELVAAAIAGVMSTDEALHLLAVRGRLMQGVPAGAMLSVRLPAADLQGWLGDALDLAAVNSPVLSVVAGPFSEIEALEARLTSAQVPHRRLHTSHAFHSRMMDGVINPFERAISGLALNAPRVPIVSTVTGRLLDAAEATDARYWSGHLRRTVHFADALVSVRTGHRALLEVGPGQTLTMLAKGTPGDAGQTIVSSLGPAEGSGGDAAAVLDAAGRLWLAGLELDWAGMHAADPRYRVPLPTYPFERKRYWIDPPAVNPVAVAQATDLVDAGDKGPGVAETAPDFAQAEEASVVRTERGGDQHREEIGVRFRALLHELSGLPPDDMRDEQTFLDLGFDSLLLTQVTKSCRDTFGVTLSMRQLLDQTPTVGAAVDAIAAQLPAAPSTDAAPPPTAAPRADQRKSALSAAAPAAAAPATSAVPSGFAGPDTAKVALTPSQQAHLQELTAHYTARTARSKAAAARHRKRHADPRTVSGFNRLWKEMVYPIVVERSSGARLWDVDGNEYIDFLNGFGPNFLGHSPRYVTDALKAQIERGIEVGPMTPLAGEVAELFCELTGAERVSFVNTGSEAVQAALRLARTVTGRDRVVVFNKDYHGNFDEVLVRGLAAQGVPRSFPIAPGIPRRAVEEMVVLEYGSDAALEYVEQHAPELAAVLVEPIQSRRPEFQPRAFVSRLREITERRGTVLIFDEVITGFRLGVRGAQGFYGVRADLATYGKVLGGGVPIGAVAGRADLMDTFDGGDWRYGDESFPAKPVTFFAGTFVRHPLAMAAAHAVLRHLREQGPEFWARPQALTARLAAGVCDLALDTGAPLTLAHFGSQMFVRLQEQARLATLVFYHLRLRGIYLLEGFPTYMTVAHTDADVDAALRAWEASLTELRDAGFWSAAADSAAAQPNRVGVRAPAARVSTSAVQQDQGGTSSQPPRLLHRAPRAVPMSAGQREMWLLARMHPDAICAGNEANVLRLQGALNEGALQRALQAVVDRHDALRAWFDADGERLWIAPELELAITKVDLIALPIAEREASLADLSRRESALPFDLEQPPLVRASLVRLASDDHALLLTAHHTVCDGWSFNVVLEELSALYNAACSGTAIALEAPPQFADWARSDKERGSAANERFWLEQFSTLPEPLELPTDRARPPLRTFAGATSRYRVPAERSAAIKAFARAQRSTLFSVLLATFDVLIYRLTQQQDFCVGVPSAGQSAAGLDSLVGHCVHFLPLRATLNPEEPFAAYVRRVREQLLAATEHVPYTYGELLEKLPLARVPDRGPLVDIQFNVERLDYFGQFAGLSASFDPTPKHAVTFDLFLNVIDEGGGLVLDCDYATDLLDEATVQQWLRHFDQLLSSAVAEPETPIGRLPILTAAEARWAIEDVNATAAPFPEHETLPALVARAAAREPQQVAVSDGSRALSYAALLDDSRQLARVLHAFSGVRPGDRVGILLEPGCDAIVALLAVLEAGAAFVPLSPGDPVGRLQQIVGNAGLQVVVTTSALRDRLPAATEPLCLDEQRAAIGRHPAVALHADLRSRAAAYVIYTSGSTGVPKGVEVSHRSVVNLLTSLRRQPGLDAADRVVAMTALTFDVAVAEIFLPLSVGATVVTTPREVVRDGQRLRAHLEANRPTLLFATPSLWRVLLEAGWSSVPGLRMWSAGEALTAPVARGLLAGGGRLWDLYGPTEATIYATVAEVADPDALTIGQPVANVQAYVLDPALAPVPIGVTGQLFLAGEGVANGYVGDEALTRSRFLPNPFRPGERMYATGDRARRLRSGSLVYGGRGDGMVKLRGYRIELGEVENALALHPDVAAAVVTLQEDAGGGSLVACIVPRTGSGISLASLRGVASAHLPAYVLPTRVVLLESLPLTSSGKVDRKRLAQLAAGAAKEEVPSSGPRTITERVLLKIWREVLGRVNIALDDDFFAVGGHSLLALRLTLRIGQEFGVPVAPAVLLEAPTIAALAKVIAPDEDQTSGARADHEGPPHVQHGSPPNFVGGAGLYGPPAGVPGTATGPGWPFDPPSSRKASTAPPRRIGGLVTMRAGGDRPALYWIHGVAGEVFSYRAVTERLAPGRPVFGFSTDWSSAAESGAGVAIEAMAARYVDELLAAHRGGPVHVGGHCSGGLLAFEIARQLEARNVGVGLVGILDYRLVEQHTGAWQSVGPFLRNFPKWLQDDVWPSGAREMLGRARSRLRRWQGTDDVRDELGMWRLPEESMQMVTAHLAALEAYRPSPYAGAVVVFEPRAYPLLGPFADAGTGGWEACALGGVHVERVTGSHSSMLAMPHAAALAASLDRWLGVFDQSRRPAAVPLTHAS